VSLNIRVLDSLINEYIPLAFAAIRAKTRLSSGPLVRDIQNCLDTMPHTKATIISIMQNNRCGNYAEVFVIEAIKEYLDEHPIPNLITEMNEQFKYCEGCSDLSHCTKHNGMLLCEPCIEADEAEDDYYDDDEPVDEPVDGVGFADPGGQSALRAETPDNPRIHSCPTCGEPDRLTTIDVARGYQCDTCADRAEGRGD
jgi:hypothetical protein